MIASLVASACGGLLLSFAFPPFRFDFLAWFAFIPLFWAIHKDPRPSFCALYGAAFGIAFFSVDLHWIYHALTVYGHFGVASALAMLAGMVLTLCLIPAAFTFLLSLLSNKGIAPSLAAPFLWTASEYIRTVLFTGFPWDLAGYSQMPHPVVIQAADITGVYGVSFLVLLVNGVLWELIRAKIDKSRPPLRLAFITGLTMILVLVYGDVRIGEFSRAPKDKSTFTVGILQGNIPQDIKWEQASRHHTFSTYERLGRQAVQEGAGLLIWPETSAPVVFGSRNPDCNQPGKISRRLRVPMLVGAPFTKIVRGATRYYNSAFLVDGPVLRYRYDKVHLVPFGEYMPLTWLLPLGPGIAAREADYSPGKSTTVMNVKGCPSFSVLICYETIFPEMAACAVRKGARMLVNITNDGWFGNSAAPYQDLAMAAMRSVENRVWLVRSANTGISAAFDPTGRMVSQIPLEQEGACTVKLPSNASAGSFYSRFGDVFAWLCIAISLLIIVSTIGFRRLARSER